jgi:MFS family permease
MNPGLETLTAPLELIRHHLEPYLNAPQLGWGGLAAAAVGLLLIFWGARLLRVSMAVASAAAGAVFGWSYAGAFELPPIAGAIIGAALAALLGGVLARFVVGILSGVTFAGIACCIYMGAVTWDLWPAFEQQYRAEHYGSSLEAQVQLRTPGDDVHQGPYDLGQQWWDYVKRQRPEAPRTAVLITAGAAAAGLVLGLLAYRLMIILGMAFVGTMLLVGGSLSAMWSRLPQTHNWIETNPAGIGLLAVGIWMTSILVQSRTSRRPQKPKPRPQ